MSRRKNGGSAFPEVSTDMDTGTYSAGGMSLRDYFAAKALTGMLASDDEDKHAAFLNADRAAEWAYQFADAMLAARSKEPSP